MRDMTCPICGKYKFRGEYDICPTCNWEYNKVELDDHSAIWCNGYTFPEYKRLYEAGEYEKLGINK